MSDGDGYATLIPVKLSMERKDHPEGILSDVLESTISEVLEHWDEPNSEQRREFEQVREQFQSQADEIANAAAETERLNASDFAFRINATR